MVTESERAEIEQYVKAKKRWRDPAALARDAIFQLMERYPAHKKSEEVKSISNTIIPGTFVGGTA